MKKFRSKKPQIYSGTILLVVLLVLILLKLAEIFFRPEDPFKGNEHYKYDFLDNPHSNTIIE